MHRRDDDGRVPEIMERDAALDRRFQTITVSEPTADEAVQIITNGHLKRFEEKHGVTISPEAIKRRVVKRPLHARASPPGQSRGRAGRGMCAIAIPT